MIPQTRVLNLSREMVLNYWSTGIKES